MLIHNPEEDIIEDVEEVQESKKAEHFASTYSLMPNENYEANGYYYETDKSGRIKRCEGMLRLEDGKRNTAHQTRTGGEYRLESDEGGHIIAKRFGGSEKIDNLVPMDSHLNRNEYKEMEENWASELEKGNTVDVQIKCRYDGESSRPTDFIVRYRVADRDGFTYDERRIFHNNINGGE